MNVYTQLQFLRQRNKELRAEMNDIKVQCHDVSAERIRLSKLAQEGDDSVRDQCEARGREILALDDLYRGLNNQVKTNEYKINILIGSIVI